MLAGNRVLYETARSIGRSVYPFAALKRTAAEWARRYGSEPDRLLRAKRRYPKSSHEADTVRDCA